MSRHNRRRTRGGHKGKGASAAMSMDHAEPPNTLQMYYSGGGSGGSYSLAPRSNTLPFGARHWQTRSMASQARDRNQREEPSLEAFKIRMFGEPDSSAPEDDEALCVKMMEYFGRLDFVQ